MHGILQRDLASHCYLGATGEDDCPYAISVISCVLLDHPSDAALQGRLGLDAGQVEATQGIHRRLADQLLNVAAERLHISGLIQVHLSPGTCPNNIFYTSAEEIESITSEVSVTGLRFRQPAWHVY